MALGPALLLSLLALANGIEVPKLSKSPAWFYIASEQSTSVSPEQHFNNATWLVSEYFSFKANFAVSFHRNKNTNEGYELVSAGRRHYYISKRAGSEPGADQSECHLDNRHDHSTLFPWRHDPPAQLELSKRVHDEPLQLVGVGALWLNLMDDREASCQLVDHDGVARSRLSCVSSKRRKSTSYELQFDPQADNAPRAAQVSRLLSVAHDQWTILEEVKQSVRITSFETYTNMIPAPRVLQRVQQLQTLCRSLHKSSSEVLFPSLVRALAESDQRNYHINYELKLYEEPEESNSGAEGKLLERHYVQEWFSFKYAMQTFVRNVRHTDGQQVEEKLVIEKLMRLFNVLDGVNVNYEMKLSSGTPVLCKFASLDQDRTLSSLSRLMRRPVKLPARKTGSNSTSARQGEMIGLGALLMNAADIRHKRQLVSANLLGHEINMDQTNYSTFIVWVAEDYKDQNQRFYFFFRKTSTLAKSSAVQSGIGDLARIELRRRKRIEGAKSGASSALGGLDDDEKLAADRWRYVLVMAVEVNDLATWLYPDELARAFTVPLNCPPLSYFADSHKSDPDAPDTPDTPLPDQSPEGDEQLPGEAEFSFPSSGEWHASLEENYKISSSWVPLAGRETNRKFQVVEYLAIDQSDWGNLHARLDVEETGKGRVQFLLDYSLDLIYRVQGESCELVADVDDWLRGFSSEMLLAGYQQMDAGKALRHYGLGGLWSLASRSAFVDLISLLPVSNGADETARELYKTVWSLRDDPELLSELKVFFMFLMKPDRELSKLPLGAREMASKLESVTVDADAFGTTLGEGVRSVEIRDIQLEPDKAQLSDFDLPVSCRSLAGAIKDARKFPSLLEELLSQQTESAAATSVAELDFELRYELHWSTAESELSLEASETNLPGKLALSSMDLVSRQRNQINLAFWSPAGAEPISMLEFKARNLTHVCKRAPAFGQLLGIETLLRFLAGDDKSKQLADLPLTNLWTAFSSYLESRRDLAQVKTTVANFHSHEQHQHTTWTVDTEAGLLQFETRPGFDQVERLASVYVELRAPEVAGQKVHLDFQLKRVARGELKSRLLQIPPKCQDAASSQAVQFPSLAKLMVPGQRLFMRSEVVLFGKVAGELDPINWYFLDEWLEYNEAYRSRAAQGRDGYDESSLRTIDQLVYPATKEYFDLSKENRCQMAPRDIAEGKAQRIANLSTGGFIGESLFRSEHKLTFYGPISLWLLSQDMDPELLFNGQNKGDEPDDLEHRLQLRHLFDESLLENWLLTDRWLSKHQTFGQFVTIFKRSAQNYGLHEIHLELIQEKVPSSNLLVQMVSYQFELDSARFEQFDAMLRIPTGFGCQRNELAKRQLDFLASDYFALEKMNPFQFHYAASLVLHRPGGRLEPQTVFNTGKLMRCPERWTSMSVGALSVDQHETHHLDGRAGAFTRVSFRDLSASSRTTVRMIDDRKGTCRIQLDRSDREQLLVLTFDDEQIELSLPMMAELMQSMNGFEKLQQFDRRQDQTQKTTFVVYESKRPTLRLNDRLQGPGLVTRTFAKVSMPFNHHAVSHSSGRFELIVPGKAHLTLDVSRMQYVECAEIILAARAEECLQDSLSDSFLHRGAQLTPSLYGAGAAAGVGRARKRNFEMRFEARIQIDDSNSRHEQSHSPHRISMAEFDLNRKYFERDFQRLLFTPPDRIAVVQLGKFSIHYEREGANLVARFELLEPVSLLHESEEIYGHELDVSAAGKLRALGIELEMRPATSKFQCSDLCELQPHKCLAFSHCRDSSCSFLQTSNWSQLRETHSDEQVESFLEPYIKTNQKCSLHFWRSFDGYPQRLYIDEMVELFRGQIAQVEESNKFSITMRINTSKRAARTKFFAVELRELTDAVDDANEEADGRDEQVENCPEFALLYDRRELQFGRTETDKDLALVKTMVLEANNLDDCLRRCQSIECKLFSFCSQSKVCSLAKQLTSWAQFEAVLGERGTGRAAAEDCAVYSWDFTHLYERFDESREPASFVWRDSASSALECAAKCELSPLSCLSFDFCHSAAGSATCFGQRTHVSFDEQLLITTDTERALVGHSNQKRALCSHYSKNVLSDFQGAANKKFAEHKSIIFHDFPLDRCAIICRRSQSCTSFEYCSKPDKHANTCYIKQEPLEGDPQLASANQTNNDLVDWQNCTVYTTKSVVMAADLELATWNPVQEDQSGSDGESLSRWLVWLHVVALASGCVVGFVHRQARSNRPITYRE